MDLYVENVMQLFREMKESSSNKILLILITNNHIQNCIDVKCKCKNLIYKDKGVGR